MNPAGPRHLDALTGLRGIAAWGVVLYHIRLTLTDLLPAPAIAALGKGYLAVDLFFMLSGFVIWYNYADRVRQAPRAASGPFLWRRLARIWPLHAVVMAGFVALALVFEITGRDTAPYPWAQLPLHLLLMQNWGFTPGLAWNHPAWSISTELAAYLLFPLAVVTARWARWPAPALIALAAALAAVLHGVFAAHGETSLGARIEQLGLVRCLLGFALGMVLCVLWQRLAARPRAAAIAWAALAAILAGGAVLALPETAFVPAAFFAGLLALALDRGVAARVLGSPLLTYLGEISYSTYLAHFGLFVVWKLLFVDASLQLGWVSLAGFLALVLAASAALYHLVEKPAQRWLNQRPPRWAQGPQPAPAG